MREVSIAPEPWSRALWSEMRACAEAHFEEVDGGVEPRRQLRLNLRLMEAMAEAGSLKVVIARQHEMLIGYFTWSILPDVECEGLVIGQQGAWYVAPGHPRVAHKMFDASVALLRQCGVEMIFPHHRTQGRGRGIGRFFRRRGAKLIQHTYSLWIGD